MTQLHATALPAAQPSPCSKPRILWGPTAGVVIAFVGLVAAFAQLLHYDANAGFLPMGLIAIGLFLYWPGFSRTQAPARRVARR